MRRLIQPLDVLLFVAALVIGVALGTCVAHHNALARTIPPCTRTTMAPCRLETP